MKKKYENPEMEIILLGDYDIIVTSVVQNGLVDIGNQDEEREDF